MDRNAVTTNSSVFAAADSTTRPLQVICAWPVSGQYGPGARFLYYALVAACVSARKTKWLKDVCLAAALLFPAIAAIHGIVLATMHREGAIDMDIYGALQLCSIGLLAAQVTVRNSRTYFNTPGRNTIFLWTGLILAGLLSLTVEFFRTRTFDCLHDNDGSPISTSAAEFPYHDSPTCGLVCSVEEGPHSPLRGGSTNNIYVIPAPDRFTFGTAVLISTACCIPAFLSLGWMWNKILKMNWNTRFGDGDEDEQIEGTNGATIGTMKKVNDIIRGFLGIVEILVFGGAVLAIIILGEMNFFSAQVRYQTEPMASIGQWAPIVGTGLAAIGSFYLLVAKDVEQEANIDASIHDYSGSLGLEAGGDLSSTSSQPIATPGSLDNRSQSPPNELQPTSSRRQRQASIGGHRREVTRVLTTVGNYLGTVGFSRFDDSEWIRNAGAYPEIPAERQRNRRLPKIIVSNNRRRDATPTPRQQRSRAASRASSPSVAGGGSSTPRAASTPSSPSPRSRSPAPSAITPRRPDLQHNPTPSSGTGSTGEMVQIRRNTLEVPPPMHHSPTRGA
ncbi:uncharacterized protein BKCO1_1000515 [Diplodia corticola]|uniref:Uncharacterized protein n=1 Tax=Diplodia corticola TaxID=236234 RepID=A0A1J9RFN2_9PEZI|nr:uncharacterized protein BKCO1_1000515 [Diplodia corticola]OJD40342.1 hypothetical protein BKCO1_1000515 [Diplodia corticola]